MFRAPSIAILLNVLVAVPTVAPSSLRATPTFGTWEALAPPPPAPITAAEADALIAKLGDQNFNVRQAAQAELLTRAAEGIASARLIMGRLTAIGVPSNDLEVKTRSEQALKDINALGPLTLTIDAIGPLKITSDNPLTKVETEAGPPKIGRITDPFFANFTGSVKTINFTVPGAVPDTFGFTAISDILAIDMFGGVQGLLYNSNEAGLGAVKCGSPGVVCIPESYEFQEVGKLMFGDGATLLSIKVRSVAPEPGTLWLVGSTLIGVLGYGSMRRRSRRQ